MRLFDFPARPTATITDVLDFQAAENGEAVWLHQDDRKVTFAEAKAIVDSHAAGLAALGVAKGDTIALVVNPSIDALLMCLAVARAGAIFTTINTDYKGEFLHSAITDSLAEVMIMDADLADRWNAAEVSRVRHAFALGGEPLAGFRALSELSLEAAPPQVEIDGFDAVQVWWSSGTTGKSKGVTHGHSSILNLAYDIASNKVMPGDVLYSCTPIYLGSPWTGTVWPSLVAGVSAGIDARFSASRFWDRIRFYDATHFFTLGAMHMHLWKREPAPEERDHRLREGQAIPLNWDQVAEFKERFGITYLSQAYGTSETFPVFQAPDDGTPWQGAALGRPVDHFEVVLFDENDHEVPLGEAGEICVRPKRPGVMFLGYFNQPDMTVKTWRNLWHHTGDMAYRDESGVYYFADRKKDYIRYNGRNISMFEVETVADRCPGVADVAAYGIVAAELESESELCLAVVRKPDAAVTAEDVARYINENAPYYFVPRYIAFMDKLPRNAHERVLKNELRDAGLPANAWDRKLTNFAITR